MLLTTPDILAKQIVRHSSDTTPSGPGAKDESKEGNDDVDATFKRHMRNARREDEKRDPEMAIEARKVRERVHALVARELSPARWPGEAWAIRKERDAQRARYKFQSRREALLQETEEVRKATCTLTSGNLATLEAQTNARSRNRDDAIASDHLRRWRHLTRRSLPSHLYLFNYEDAEVSLILSEQRERVAWKPPFIPRSFEGQLPALHSDAEHPIDRSDTTDFVADGPNTKGYGAVGHLLDRSRRFNGGTKGIIPGQDGDKVSAKPSYARKNQALLESKPSDQSGWGIARPCFFDVF